MSVDKPVGGPNDPCHATGVIADQFNGIFDRVARLGFK